MNTGMHLTFDLLSSTPNEAAERLLSLSLLSPETNVRRLGISAGLQRHSRSTAMEVLRMWDRLTDGELRAVQDHPTAMQPIVAQVLREPTGSPLWTLALDALRMLNLDTLLPLVIERLETCGDDRLRNRMLAAVLELASSLGDAARRGRERASARQPVVDRLAQSVRNFERHHCEGLCEAFLATSCWGDRELRTMLTDDPQTSRLLSTALFNSSLPGVIHLVAGYIRRRQIPPLVQRAIEQRADDAFRDSLLAVIGDSPPRLALRNIRNGKTLTCLQDYSSLVGRTPIRHHSALLHAHTANTRDSVAQLTVILDVISRGSRRVDAAVIASLSALEPFDSKAMMRAAMAVADLDLDYVARDALAQLVWRMIQLLDHPDAAVVGGLRQVMRPLHVEQFLSLVDDLTVASPSRWGGLLRRIDPQAVAVLGDELRNPVLTRRTRAIKAAVACNAVDSLGELLIHTALHDHREARVLAVAALERARCAQSLETLARLAEGPAGGVRDAAVKALRKRTGAAQAS